MVVPKKVKNRLYHLAILLLGIHPKKLKTGSLRDTCTPLFKAVLFTIANRWKQPKFPQMDE